MRGSQLLEQVAPAVKVVLQDKEAMLPKFRVAVAVVVARLLLESKAKAVRHAAPQLLVELDLMAAAAAVAAVQDREHQDARGRIAVRVVVDQAA
jgi:hypothetical protein